jgi:hypothetical protein
MRRGLLAVLLLGLACTPPALAGTVGTWERFTGDDGGNTSYLGLHRTSDGVLHAVWESVNPAATSSTDILHRTVAPNGVIAPRTLVVNWPDASPPDVAAAPGGGLLTLWGGIKGSADSGFATSDDSGAAWAESPTAPIASGSLYASPVSIENGPGGTVFSAWYGTSGTWVHLGTDPATPNFNYQTPLGGYAESAPNLAVDGADGTMWLGWPVFSAGANNGAWVTQVDTATGAPAGAPLKVPGSSTTYGGAVEGPSTLGRWAITGRPGRPGVFVASPAGYPSENKIVFWRVGQPSSITLDASAAQHRQVAMTADADGRIIVVWGTDSGGAGGQLFARVSNTDATSFGPTFEIPAPPSAGSLGAIAASGQSGGLIDLFANVTEKDNQTIRYYHTQALPPPVLAKAVNAKVVSGVVKVKLPGSNTFVSLTHESQIPVGATVDATSGRVRILEALPGGKTQSSDFFQGVFRVTQAKTGLADMTLVGGNFSVCPKAARAGRAAKGGSIRQLWGAGKGKFRTKGRYATASIRGTTWLTDDRCNGTLIKVTQGSVTVRDLVARKSVVVKKGQSYLAKKR